MDFGCFQAGRFNLSAEISDAAPDARDRVVALDAERRQIFVCYPRQHALAAWPARAVDAVVNLQADFFGCPVAPTAASAVTSANGSHSRPPSFTEVVTGCAITCHAWPSLRGFRVHCSVPSMAALQ